MPRNANGSYQLPPGNPVTSGTTISADWANRTMSDVQSALSNTLTADCVLPLNAPLKFADGIVSAPGITFNSDSSTGIYRKATSTMGLTAGGIDALVLSPTGGVLTGNLSVSGTATVVGATTVQGAVTLGSTLNVTGASTISSVTASGNASIGGTLTVTGATTMTGALTGSSSTMSGTITANLFSGSGASLTNIPNAALVNKTVTLGTTSVALGGSTTSIADLTLTGTPVAPTAAVGTNTTQVANTAFVQAGMSAYLPRGVVVMWSGTVATIPSGWALCNGANGTPNLVDRFIVGAGSAYAPAAIGGSADAVVVAHSHTFSGMTGGQSADHTHSGYTSIDGAHDHAHDGYRNILRDPYPGSLTGSDTGGSGSEQAIGPGDAAPMSLAPSHQHSVATYGASNDHAHGYSGVTTTVGTAAANANLPPYFALAFIMKL